MYLSLIIRVYIYIYEASCANNTWYQMYNGSNSISNTLYIYHMFYESNILYITYIIITCWWWFPPTRCNKKTCTILSVRSTSTLSDTIWIFFPSSWHIGNAVLLRMFSFVFFFQGKKVNCNSYIIFSWFVQTMYFPNKNQLRLNSTSSPAAKPHSSMAYSPDRLTGVAWFKIQWLPYTYTYKINLYSTCKYVVKYIQECIYLMWICIYI